METSKIANIIGKINEKLEKMKRQSDNIFTSEDENDFFQNFLNYCTNKDNKTYAKKTFFDKIKNWYHKFLGENRNINLEEFKFINEEANLLSEAICDKESLEQVKNIFSTWKKGFIYNYKTKFNFDVNYIQSELNNILKIASQDKPSYMDFISQENPEKKPEVTQDKKRTKQPPIEVSKPSEKVAKSSVRVPKPSSIRVPKPSSIRVPKPSSIEVPKPSSIEAPKEAEIPNNFQDELDLITKEIENLGIVITDDAKEKITRILKSKRNSSFIDLINSGDVKEIKFLLN